MTGFSPIRPPDRSALVTMRDVVFAIFMRELKTRFGAYRLGLVWAIVEPLSFILIMSWIRLLVGDGDVYGIPGMIFFALGILQYNLFSNIVRQTSSSIPSNRGLFAYRQVKPIDAVLARTLLEFLVICSAGAVLMVLYMWFGNTLELDDPLLVLAAIVGFVLFGMGFGLMVTSAVLFVPEVEKVVGIITRPLFFASGIFFSLYDIPSQYHELLLLNPLLHGVELVRHGFYRTYPSAGLSLEYLYLWVLGAVFLGFSSYRLVRSRLVAS